MSVQLSFGLGIPLTALAVCVLVGSEVCKEVGGVMALVWSRRLLLLAIPTAVALVLVVAATLVFGN